MLFQFIQNMDYFSEAGGSSNPRVGESLTYAEIAWKNILKLSHLLEYEQSNLEEIFFF